MRALERAQHDGLARFIGITGHNRPEKCLKVLREFDVQVIHGWGMTEMSPVGTACRLKPFMKDLSEDEQLSIRAKQGYPLFGVSMKIVDDLGQELPHDGKSFGRLVWIGETENRLEDQLGRLVFEIDLE